MSTAESTAPMWIERLGRGIVRNWVWLLNAVALMYAGLPWLAPLLQCAGFKRSGALVFALYGRLCHQLPQRSFFVCGHQVAFCHRCAALYTAVVLTGLAYGAIRWNAPLSTRVLKWAAVPILIDGLWHMANDVFPSVGLRPGAHDVGSVYFWVRMITGVLFGAAAVLWAYPRFEREFAKA